MQLAHTSQFYIFLFLWEADIPARNAVIKLLKATLDLLRILRKLSFFKRKYPEQIIVTRNFQILGKMLQDYLR